MAFCTQCGTEVGPAFAFCSNCGTALSITPSGDDAGSLVRVAPFDRWVPVESMMTLASNPTALAEMDNDAWIENTSHEATLVGTRFEPTGAPRNGDLVPIDCVWAFYPHPGPAPALSARRLADRLAQLGTLRGRLISEIVGAVGPPNARQGTSEGITATWSESRLFGTYMIVIGFDRYGVCMQVLSEASS